MRLLAKIQLVFLSALMMIAVSCSNETSEVSKNPEAAISIPKSSVEAYISAYTSGEIQRKSKVRIRFNRGIIPDGDVGNDGGDVLSFTPEIAGKIIWTNTDELTVTPKNPLPSDIEYSAMLDLSGKFPDLSEKTFSFKFSTMKQSLNLKVTGLQSVSKSDLIKQKLTGVLTTSDYAEDVLVEKILSAHQGNKEFEISWKHSDDGTRHRFSAEGINREKTQTSVDLSWNGKPINVALEGSRSIPVSALGVFRITNISTIQGDNQHVRINFSDPLDTSMDMKGLIRLGDKGLKLTIRNNQILAYPDSTLRGNVLLTIEKHIRNIKGRALASGSTKTLKFEETKPGVRFVGKGVILPDNSTLTIPFEAVYLNSVQVTAFEVFENNIGRFLQDNTLEGSQRLRHVGRFIWRKTVALNPEEDLIGSWTRYSLDVSSLFKDNPNSLFRVTLSFNKDNSAYPCSETERAVLAVKEPDYANLDQPYLKQNSSWDYYENSKYWRGKNPCQNRYYNQRNKTVTASRNFLASNIGIIVKQGTDQKMHIVTTDLLTAEPLAGASVKIFNFQDQMIHETVSDESGFATIETDKKIFYLLAQKKENKGYLRFTNSALQPVSNFDTGGVRINKGLKGFIYGERGVWRPGDNIYLTFVLEDENNRLPDNHPVSLELYNPRGQLVSTTVPVKTSGDFYAFHLKTSQSAPTGNWMVKVFAGGNLFQRDLKIETIVPNRLKVLLDTGKKVLSSVDGDISFTLFGQWLHGAKASKLAADISVVFSKKAVYFDRFQDYDFNDPAREFSSRSYELFNGKLDEEGYAKFTEPLEVNDASPGMLTATFTSRVFEKGGGFSIDSINVPYHPYDTYVGIQTPKGDVARGMLLTDIDHKVKIATVNAKGEPVSSDRVEVSIYKISWKWWWDKSGDSLAKYSTKPVKEAIKSDVISTKDGYGEWAFKIKYPSWGRYLIRVKDLDGNHATGKILYVDWPGWAGRAQEGGAGAAVLSFSSDKKKYFAGETATINLPAATQGRALVTIENGTRILKSMWTQVHKGENRVSIPLTREMCPNVYVSVTLLQPHQDKKNDRPIRLFGVIPLLIDDKESILSPELTVAKELAPDKEFQVQVKEASGRAMTYTIAMVDEGLLGLTRYKAPDLRSRFNRKEALAIKTWDMFNDVAGAYGGELERLLSIGGDDDLEEGNGKKSKRRFKPVVEFLGPFELPAGEGATHSITMPQYVGAVRFMVVAGKKGAYGKTSASVPVRQSLMILPSLPRVLNPEDELNVPVSVFVMDDTIKDVAVSITVDDYFKLTEGDARTLHFNEPGDKNAFFRIKTLAKTGTGTIKIKATGNNFFAEKEINIPVRNPGNRTVRFEKSILEADGTPWTIHFKPHGIEGSNSVILEISSIPHMNLEQRLSYLIRYPHGCIEQTTSSVFPQLYLSEFSELSEEQEKKIENNIISGIERLTQFQTSEGGFSYWPGSGSANDWGTNYAGHFLVEAYKKGYSVPSECLSKWQAYQKKQADAWTAGSSKSTLGQAYRLFTLSLSGASAQGAMNRLRHSDSLTSAARWQLASAYWLGGQIEAANELVRNDTFAVKNYNELGNTFGSGLRDKALILLNLSITNKRRLAQPLVDEITAELSSERHLNTQAVAYALMAMGKFIKGGETGKPIACELTTESGLNEVLQSKAPLFSKVLSDFPIEGDTVTLLGKSNMPLFVTLLCEGIPPMGEEISVANGLKVGVTYSEANGNTIDLSSLNQGNDVVMSITVTNTTNRAYENLALTTTMPSGWQIHNPRFTIDNYSTPPQIDYQDIRDDRVFTYFKLNGKTSKNFMFLVNCSYKGYYYMPGVNVEAMYDATINGRTKGRWVTIRNE